MEHFAAPGRELKYWVVPNESPSWSSWIEGISRNGQAVLVGVNEMDLISEGHLPRVDVLPAITDLLPFQTPPNAIQIKLGATEDYWRKSQMDRFLLLSIGTPITSELAFITMFNEAGRIDGGTYARTDEFGSERLCGPKRYPSALRMLSKEVDDVLVQKLKPLDVLTSRVPHCSMPAPEAVQMHVTTAYMYDPEVATACLRASMDARKAMGYADCSTGPEVRIFDHLWRGKAMVDSVPETQGFDEEWGLVADTNPEWKDVLHVDNWRDAQHVQRQGTSAENELLVMSRRDKGRRIWPVAVSATRQQSVGSSNAVKSANARFPWAGSGFDLTLGMSAAYKGPGEVRTSLLAAATKPQQYDSRKGHFFDGYFFDCSGCWDILYATTFGSVFCFDKGGFGRKGGKQSGEYRLIKRQSQRDHLLQRWQPHPERERPRSRRHPQGALQLQRQQGWARVLN